MSVKNGSEASSVVVGGNVKQNRPGLRSRPMSIIIGGILLFALLCIGGYATYRHFHHDSKSGKQAAKAGPNYVSKNIAAPTSTNYDSDLAKIDENIQNATDDPTKSALYLKKADLIVINKGYNNDALAFAQKSEELSPSLQSAFLLATIHEALNDKADAIKYYSLYLSRMTPEYKQANPGFFEHYQQVLEELQKS